MRCHFTPTGMTGQKKIVARVEDVEKTGNSDIASENVNGHFGKQSNSSLAGKT